MIVFLMNGFQKDVFCAPKADQRDDEAAEVVGRRREQAGRAVD